MLSGYKTYIVAALAVLGAIGGFLDGDLTLQAAIQLGVTGILGATLRGGIASTAK